MNQKPSTTLLIFAKAPAPGFAKTRLIPALGSEGAARLAQKFLYRTLEAAQGSDLERIELCVTPAIDDSRWQSAELPENITISDQGDGDLGERMARAAERALKQSGRVILTGTDCVEISPSLLNEAAEALEQVDAVIYPTADGGYALLGLNSFDMSLFTDMPWSTDKVAQLTLERLNCLNWRVRLGRQLHDIDTPEDLSRWFPTGSPGAI